MRTAIVVRHVAFEDLDGFEPAFWRHGYAVKYVDMCDQVYSDSHIDGADILVILGGPIGANDEATYPFLKTELQAIERRLHTERPMMGICLGAQLIARVAGARVYRSHRKEIGFGSIALTTSGRNSALEPFAGDPMTLHWHGDTFDLPDDACHLASSNLCEHQAFSLGDHTIGFQFHPEATGRKIEHWLVGHAAELSAERIDPNSIRIKAAEHHGALCEKADRVAELWLRQLSQIDA